MFLEQRLNYFNPPAFNLATNSILGTTQQWNIDRTWPIEEILIFVNFDVTTAIQPAATPATPDQFDNMLQILQRINLSVNDGRQPRSVVNVSGVGMLEYVSNAGWNLDTATSEFVSMCMNAVNGTFTIPVGTYQVCYRIPCAPQQVAEPLRTRMYLPVHTYPQDPVLTLTFNSLANLATQAGAIGTVRVDVVLLRRVPTQGSEKLLRSTAGSNPSGYLDWDLLETPFSLPLGTNSEVRLPIPVPGNYIDMLFRQYKGGAPLSRTVTVDNDIGDTIAHNLGMETRWRLETGSVVVREWRWKHLRAMNDWTKPQTWGGHALTPFLAGASAGSPTIPFFPSNFPNLNYGSVIGTLTTQGFRAGTSAMIPFLTDGITGDNGNEFGSLLDCNTPANNGLKMELIGTPASVATNPSQINVIGRRIFGDVARWQKF
jgi:hypothetical protein